MESSPPRLISVVLPVYNEDRNIAPCLRQIGEALRDLPHEILVCYDFDEDRTLPAIAAMADKPAAVRLVKNDLGKGPAFALRAGLAAARGDVIVTTMADLSDPPSAIPAMARKIRDEGAHVVSGSRYMKGGSQRGGPRLKGLLSRLAGLSLHWIGGLATRDATNNFRAYSREFVRKIEIESTGGFEFGLELTVKAHVGGFKVAEVPTTWTDRTAGQSRFRLRKWLPLYLRWYCRAMAAPLLVWGTWLVMAAAALYLVRQDGRNVPFWDEWDGFVPYVTGAKPVTPEWFWSPHNEHRIPAPRALFLLSMALSRGDFRSGMVVNVFLLALVAWGFILAARRLRGRMEYWDALFPMIALNWAHADNMLWGFQLGFTLPTALASFTALAILRGDPVRSPGASARVGLAILLLPLCGANGLAFALPLAAWALYAGICAPRQTRGPAFLLTGFGIAALLLAGFALLGLSRPDHHPPPGGVGPSLRAALEFLAISGGTAGRNTWPLSGLAVAGIAGTVMVHLARRWKGDAVDRTRHAGLFCFMAGALLLAAAIGWGRGGWGEKAGFAGRYATLSIPLLSMCGLMLVTSRARFSGEWIGVTLLVVAAVSTGVNAMSGRRLTVERRKALASFERDIRTGMAIPELARRYEGIVHPRATVIETGLNSLKAAGRGPYRRR